jgi:hypothetical protein
MLKIPSEFKNLILQTAPSDEFGLFNTSSLVIWSGASDDTIWADARVNWAFRALHDALHLETGLGFSPKSEIELGRIQASKYEGLLADLVYCEVAGQAEHYLKTGQFVVDQVEFTIQYLKTKGVLK